MRPFIVAICFTCSLVASLVTSSVAGQLANASVPDAQGRMFVAWNIRTEVRSPMAETRLVIKARDARDTFEKGRFRITIQAAGASSESRSGAVALTVDGATSALVTVQDRRGAIWHQKVAIHPRAQTTVTVMGRWTDPTFGGEFINTTDRCAVSRDSQRLRFAIKIPGDLYVGRPVAVAPGRRGAGPALPDGDYTVEVTHKRGRKWKVLGHHALTVAGGRWESAVGCGSLAQR